MPRGYWEMTNQRGSWRRAIYQKVALDNCGFLQCCTQVSLCFVYTLKCTSLVLESRISVLMLLAQPAADRHAAMLSCQRTSLSLCPSCQSVHVSILFSDICPTLCWQPVKYCHSFTLLLGFDGSGNKMTLLTNLWYLALTELKLSMWWMCPLRQNCCVLHLNLTLLRQYRVCGDCLIVTTY